MTLAFIFLVACHAVVEDTLVFIPLGHTGLAASFDSCHHSSSADNGYCAHVEKMETLSGWKGSNMSDKQVTTILFDLDGTLINTNELIIASFFAYTGALLSEQV